MSRTYTFCIEGCKPEKISIRRWGKYLDCLATVMRYSAGIHLKGITKGSTRFQLQVDSQYSEQVETQLCQLREGFGNKRAYIAKNKLNQLLAEDNADGYLSDETSNAAKILYFPGKNGKWHKTLGPFDQKGSLDGVLVSVIGAGETVHVQLANGELRYTGIETNRETARELATHLYEHLRIFGIGWWWRNGDGIWGLKKFHLDHYEVLKDEKLKDTVRELRAVKGYAWEEMEDPYGALKAMR